MYNYNPQRTSLILPLLLLGLGCVCITVSSAENEKCVPGINCKPPGCRCWNDPRIPGGIARDQTPVMILLSFDYAVNEGNVELYRSIFKGIKNPNGCAAKGTFFVQSYNSNFDVIKSLYDDGHEIGVTSASGYIPTSSAEWVESYRDVKLNLEKAGIPGNEILGARSPDLFVGGDMQFQSIEKNQLEYDTSCVSQEHDSTKTMIWPYTYDFVDTTPKCTIGRDVTSTHKGKWQFLVADLKIGNKSCAVPSACSQYINSTQQAFDFLFHAFANHYEGGRSPYVLYLDPLWLSKAHQYKGTVLFLQLISASLDDAWILTNQQALAWIKDPTPMDKIKDFGPWKC